MGGQNPRRVVVPGRYSGDQFGLKRPDTLAAGRRQSAPSNYLRRSRKRFSYSSRSISPRAYRSRNTSSAGSLAPTVVRRPKPAAPHISSTRIKTTNKPRNHMPAINYLHPGPCIVTCHFPLALTRFSAGAIHLPAQGAERSYSPPNAEHPDETLAASSAGSKVLQFGVRVLASQWLISKLAVKGSGAFKMLRIANNIVQPGPMKRPPAFRHHQNGGLGSACYAVF